MKHARIQSLLLTPRSLLVIALLFSIALAQSTPAPSPQIDSRFGSGSKELALKWQHIKGSIPHAKIPNDPHKIKAVSSWGMDYAIGLVKVVGTGFAIAIGSLLSGLIYGFYKLIRHCMCPRDESEREERSYTPIEIYCPTIVYAIAWVFLLTGVCIGIANNPLFSDGVTDLGNEVINLGDSAVNLGNGLINGIDNIVALIPTSIDDLVEQFAGVDPLADEVEMLSDDINSTSALVSKIKDNIAIIAANVTAVSQLLSQLTSIDNSSIQIISHASELTSQVSDKLRSSYNQTVSTLDSKKADISTTVDPIENTAKGIVKTVSDITKTVNSFVKEAESYDKTRAKAVTALLVLVLLVTFSIVAGYISRIKVIFNIIAAFSFVLMFLIWMSGSVHFLLGMALYDACPVLDSALISMLTPNATATLVLEGCLAGNTILQSLQIDAYNLSSVFDYKNELQQFSNFSSEFNFSTIDDYFDSIQGIQINLTEIALNLTVSSFGWNESDVYLLLDGLNNQTSPDYFDLDNYTSANSSNYPPPRNQTVYDLQNSITEFLQENATIYNFTATLQQELIASQADIDDLRSNMTEFHARLDGIKDDVIQLETQNITNCLNILDNLQSNISSFFLAGNCDFVGTDYFDMKTSICQTMQPAIDTLTVAQFLIGLSLIPIAILAEVLARRIPRCNRISPCGEEGDTEEGFKGKGTGYSVALTDSPAMIRNRKANMTATVGVAESRDSDTGSTSGYQPDRRSGGVSVTYE